MISKRFHLGTNFLGETTTAFSEATGFIPFTADLSGNVWKLGLGGTWDFDIDSPAT
jgi:hypothetical protein